MKFPYIPCYCSTKKSYVDETRTAMFPYIPCYCSTQKTVGEGCFMYEFPYIPCYCSTVSPKKKWLHRKQVSIHPMLLFNKLKGNGDKYDKRVSIHPMLLFNMKVNRTCMLCKTFPYIPCYCSTFWDTGNTFNRQVSIHPMLLFNTKN